jgi:hypothetical protein
MGLFSSFGRSLSSFFTGGAKPAPVTKPSGSDGVYSYGGYLASGERSNALVGPQKWVTYTNALNYPIIATGCYYSTGLLAGTEWHCEPNELGGADADRAVEIVEQGLLKAQLPTPWSAVVAKMSLFEYMGFALCEWIVKTRADDMVVFADIAHRPQYTIDRWDKPDEQQPWQAVSQLTHAGGRYVIPRSRLFYCVADRLTDSPDGVGRLRHVVELHRQLEVLEALEGHAFQTDLRGMPLARAPLSELKALALQRNPGASDDEVRAFVAAATANIREIAANSAKTPDKVPYILFDSEPFKGADPNVFTGVLRWTFELIKGQTNGLPDVNVLIKRKQAEIARLLGIEFAMMGQAGGAYSMHEDKTSMFATFLQNTLTTIAACATRDLARVLVALNGLDPDTCCPKLVAEPISTDAIETTCRALSYLGQAGLPQDWEGWNVILKRMHLPPLPEMTPAMMGMLGIARRPAAPRVAAPAGGADGQDAPETLDDNEERVAA